MDYIRKSIVIIGAGPAGLSLSATLKMASIQHLVLDKNNFPGGSLPEIHNDFEDFTFGVYENGTALAGKMNEFVKHYDIDINFKSNVLHVDIKDKIVFYKNANNSLSVNYDILVIASGIRFNVDERFIDKPFFKDIYYRISPSLNDFIGKVVAVIGSGDNATVAALRLAEVSDKVYIVNRTNNWKSRIDLLDKVNRNQKIEILTNTRLIDLEGESDLTKMKLFDEKEQTYSQKNINKIVFKIGYLPNSEFISNVVDLDENGYIKTNNKYLTSVDDIFAIGDIVAGEYKRVAIAMGHGTDLGNYFLKEHLQ